MNYEDEFDKVKETVEVIGGYARKCVKCEKIVRGKPLSFRFDSYKKCFVANEWEAPKGWGYFAYSIYPDREATSVFITYICTDCLPEILKFIGWKMPNKGL